MVSGFSKPQNGQVIILVNINAGAASRIVLKLWATS
jgi:hypothetical protein